MASQDTRPLPEGWVMSFSKEYNRSFFVDTRAPGGPRSIWVHPLDDPEYQKSAGAQSSYAPPPGQAPGKDERGLFSSLHQSYQQHTQSYSPNPQQQQGGMNQSYQPNYGGQNGYQSAPSPYQQGPPQGGYYQQGGPPQGYYPQQGYPQQSMGYQQQPAYYQQQQAPPRKSGMGAGGAAALGLGGGLLGGMLLGGAMDGGDGGGDYGGDGGGDGGGDFGGGDGGGGDFGGGDGGGGDF